jgi:hypothetical protein
MGERMQKLPTAAWVCITVAFLGVLAVFAVLSVSGSDGTEFRSFLNTVVNLATLLLSGGALAYAGAAQKQTNGALDDRVQDAVKAALTEQRAADVKPGGVLSQ